MTDSPDFVPGLELARDFYREVIRPIVDSEFPGLTHSAGLIGPGSDVLGFDSPRSSDHDWGPRGYVFIAEADAERSDEIERALSKNLPATFRGYSTHFSEPDPQDNDTRTMAPGRAGDVNSMIVVCPLEELLARTLGRRRSAEPDLLDWFSFPEQSLLELTSGEVFHDGLGNLEPMRARFAYYPEDVWLHRLSCQWQRIAEEESLVGRCAEAGDELGSRIVAARVSRDMMRLAFLMERRYAPYSKWLGTAFARLACGPQLAPLLERALAADSYPPREQALAQAGTELAKIHNALEITEPLDPTPRNFFSRPYQVLFTNRFDQAIRKKIRDPRLRALPSQLPAVDQLADLAGATRSPILTGRMRKIYDDQ